MENENEDNEKKMIKNSGKGIRLPGNMVVVREYNGQMRVTIPSVLFHAVGLEDKSVCRWITSGQSLMLIKVNKNYDYFIEQAKKRADIKESVENFRN